MKKFWNKFQLKRIAVQEITDGILLLNLYLTQALTLIVALVLLWIQHQNTFRLLRFSENYQVWLWGAGLAAAVLLADAFISKWVPEEVTDDGGINEMLFGKRSVLHIIWISLMVSICEELLFRGAIQYWLGAYWTSIVFAAIHVRYLRHWLMTGLVFSISYGLGWVYNHTGMLWAPITAHFIIDVTMGLIIRFRKDE